VGGRVLTQTREDPLLGIAGHEVRLLASGVLGSVEDFRLVALKCMGVIGLVEACKFTAHIVTSQSGNHHLLLETGRVLQRVGI